MTLKMTPPFRIFQSCALRGSGTTAPSDEAKTIGSDDLRQGRPVAGEDHQQLRDQRLDEPAHADPSVPRETMAILRVQGKTSDPTEQ